MTAQSTRQVEALYQPGGRVAFFPILPAADRPPIGCVACHRPLDGTLDGGQGFFVESARPDGSGSGGMAVCAECVAEAMRPDVLFYQARRRAHYAR